MYFHATLKRLSWARKSCAMDQTWGPRMSSAKKKTSTRVRFFLLMIVYMTHITQSAKIILFFQSSIQLVYYHAIYIYLIIQKESDNRYFFWQIVTYNVWVCSKLGIQLFHTFMFSSYSHSIRWIIASTFWITPTIIPFRWMRCQNLAYLD